MTCKPSTFTGGLGGHFGRKGSQKIRRPQERDSQHFSRAIYFMHVGKIELCPLILSLVICRTGGGSRGLFSVLSDRFSKKWCRKNLCSRFDIDLNRRSG
ncbi:hypothetical protein CEXT_625391 [Caerostris extrusa]|uniref:Uncharacterized protein n=1 Tax=Caerostris extrusa TaxID=172846 RepID=A0AAV4TZN9_CAEEX|nr:hypothetical protein CEXT_625391 [Caerostris extrusa]